MKWAGEHSDRRTHELQASEKRQHGVSCDLPGQALSIFREVACHSLGSWKEKLSVER